MRTTHALALYALLCAIWGSTWLVIKVGYGGLGPFNVAALRFLLAGLVFVPIVAFSGARWPRGRTEWTLVAWVGAVLFAADYGLIYWGEQFIESGLTATLFATLPLLTAIAAHFYVPGDRLTWRKLGGTVLAFAGTATLFADHLRIDPSKLVPMLAILGSSACAATAGVATKRHGKDIHAAALNAPAMLFGGALLLVASLIAGDGFEIPRDAPTWSAILYLAIGGSVVTFLVYFTLLKRWNVTSLSFISVFTVVVALILGFVFLDERPTLLTGVGALAILSGVALSITKPKAATPPTPQEATDP